MHTISERHLAVVLCEACHGRVRKSGDSWYHVMDWPTDRAVSNFYQGYLETIAREVKEYAETDIIPSTVGAANYHTGNKSPDGNVNRKRRQGRRSADDSGAIRGMPGSAF